MYGVTFEDYLVETNDNLESFNARHKNRIRLLKASRDRISKRIQKEGINHPHSDNLTLGAYLEEIDLEIFVENENFNYISSL